MLNSITSPLDGIRSPFGAIRNPFAAYAIGGQTPQTIADFEADKYASASKNFGPELVTNGTFDTDISGWTDPANATPSWEASFSGRSGVYKLENTSSSGVTSTQVVTGLTVGKVYTLSAYLYAPSTNSASNAARVSFVGSGTPELQVDAEDEWQYKSLLFVATSTSRTIYAHSYVGIGTPTSGDIAYFDNISLREVVSYSPASTTAESLLTHTRAGTATYTDSTGTLQTAASGELRKDNHIWDGSSWVKRCLVEPQSTNLLLNSDTLATQNATVTAALHTLHFTGTGTVTLSGASTAGPLVGTGTGEQNRVSLQFTPTAGTLTLTVTGTVSNAQLETGVQTSYIPTAGATVTRPADALSIDSTLLPYDSTAMTIAMAYNITGDDGTLFNWEADANNKITASAASGTYTFTQIAAGTSDSVTGGTLADGTNTAASVASRHTDGDINAAIDGTALTVNSTVTALADLSASDFVIAPNTAINIETIRVLGGYGATDAELEAATT